MCLCYLLGLKTMTLYYYLFLSYDIIIIHSFVSSGHFDFVRYEMMYVR